jgi:hypothetical protein
MYQGFIEIKDNRLLASILRFLLQPDFLLLYLALRRHLDHPDDVQTLDHLQEVLSKGLRAGRV